jgi:DNA-binding transcriptional MerR regulator
MSSVKSKTRVTGCLVEEQPFEGDGEFTVQQAALRTGLSEHTLRYYERAGLLQPIRRQDSSRHRRYSSNDVARIATLACLRATGMSLDQMRRYFALAEQGENAAPALRELLEIQRQILEERLEQMRWHQEYVSRKIDYWGAVETGNRAGAEDIARDLTHRVRQFHHRARPEAEPVGSR